MYLLPAASSAALIAASSVFQRSSWKFDQETPMVFPSARALAAIVSDSAAPASNAVANLFIMFLPIGPLGTKTKLFFSSFEKMNDSAFGSCQYLRARSVLSG